MWLTGFDAPSCSTVYLDKPMRNHTLMQTIARANRVYPGKHSGLIVDYANVFVSLEKALAFYAKGRGSELPIRDKQKLVEMLRRAIAETDAFCGSQGINLVDIENLPAGRLDRLTKIVDAVEHLISPEELRRDFLVHERLVRTLFQAVKPDPFVLQFASRTGCLTTIAQTSLERTGERSVDVSTVMTDLN
jgi:type I restriction enzyme, R subunit